MFIRKLVVRVLLCAMFVLFMGKASVAATQTADDYNDYPLTNGAIVPNVLIMMDNSGSMHDAAYKLAPYSGSQPWYGYFSSNQTCMSGAPAMYTYNAATYQFELSSSGTWLGSFLNWAAMQEVDVAKKVVVGGKTYPVATLASGAGAYLNSTTGGAVASYPGRPHSGTNILIGEPSGGFSLSGTVPAASGTIPSAYTVKSLTVTIKTQVDNSPPAPLVGPLSYFQVTYKNASNVSTTDPTKYYIKIKKEQSSPCDATDFLSGDVAGVVQKTGSVVRWGLENFQSDSKFGIIVEPIVAPGYSQTYVANEEIYSPQTYTPLATSLYTALAYFSQNQLSAYNLTSRSSGTGMQYHSTDFDSTTKGKLGDPYFYSSTTPPTNTGQTAPCAKSFVIVITDGTANNDNLLPASVTGFDSSKSWNDSYPYGAPLDQSGAYDPMPDVALIAHTQDIRPDLTGNQNLSIYTMFVFSSEADITRATTLLKDTAQAGGFNDSNGNNIPDVVSEYASLNRTYASSSFNPTPDTYFEATDGNLIEGEFTAAINSLLKRAASATAVSVLSTSANGAGNVYQAFFVPSKTISIATGSSVSTSTVVYTNTATTTATSTANTTSTSTSRATSTLTSTTTSTSSATGTNSTYTTATSTGTSSTTRTTTSTTTSTSTFTGGNDNAFTSGCPAGDTCSGTQISGSGGSKVFRNIDVHPTTGTSTGTPFTTSTSHTTSTASSYTTSHTTSSTTTVATSTNTSRTTSTASSFSTSTGSSVTTGTGTNTNVYSTYNSINLVWLGDLMQISVDANGSLRDVAGNCIGFSFDPVNFVTNVNWFALGSNGICATSSPSAVTPLLSFTGYNWNAGPQLLTGTAASRTIFTSIGGVETQFTTANDAVLCRYMNVDAYATCAGTHPNTDNLINWVRGSSVVGYRDRTYDAANNQYKLGDILHSTPTVVGAPQEDYNLLYQDGGYATYFTSNESRQRVVFAGANDGMLHAFDAGTFSGGAFSNGTGNELWAYIPYNLLPHLQWLGSPSYGLGGSHVEFVDAKMKVTDVNFGTSASPNWKTVLIGGMRLGGGKINKANNSGDNSLTFRSAYFAIDITVPTAPVVLWESNATNFGGAFSSTPSALGFTMSYPSVAKVGDCFYAVVGSGPKVSYVPDYNGSSNQNGSVFVININACSATGAPAGSATSFQTPDANSYFSDPISVDITLNPSKPLIGASGTSYGTDVIYIGETFSTTYPTPNPNGTALGSRMWRLVTNNDVNPANWKFGMLYTMPAGAPISAAGAASEDALHNIWLFWGTGRLLSAADQTDAQTQAFYGVKDPCWMTNNSAWDNSCLTASALTPSLNSGNLVNVTGTVVTTTGTVSGGGSGATSFSGLTADVQAKAGWYFTLNSLLPGNSATERAITKPAVIGGLVLFSSFIPNNSNPCSQSGSSFTYAVFYLTGTASPIPAIGTYTSGGSTVVLSRTATASSGMASNIALHSGTEKGVTAFIQMSTGEVITVSAVPPITAKSGIISWREM